MTMHNDMGKTQQKKEEIYNRINFNNTINETENGKLCVGVRNKCLHRRKIHFQIQINYLFYHLYIDFAK